MIWMRGGEIVGIQLIMWIWHKGHPQTLPFGGCCGPATATAGGQLAFHDEPTPDPLVPRVFSGADN